MSSHFLLQGIFPTQESNPGLPHCRQKLYHLSHQGSPIKNQFYVQKINITWEINHIALAERKKTPTNLSVILILIHSFTCVVHFQGLRESALSVKVLVETSSLTYDQNGENTSFDRKLHFLLLKTVITVIMSGFQRLPGVRRTIDS